MDPDTYQRASQLFSEALDLPGDSRSAFLEEACGDDAELSAAVRELLEHDHESSADDLFGSPLIRLDGHGQGASPPAAQEVFPRPFGRYTLLRKLGAGGMGVVYEAEQDQPRQRVALKLIAPHAMSGTALARFRREAEVLGRLKHPGIAAVFDAGEVETAAGAQPFLSMELVKGRQIVSDVMARGLDMRERVDLVADVCDAVQHAHECGIVHRDLKPDNVLVTEHGVAKVLDFGVAHVMDGALGDVSVLTIEGQAIGTLNYMSPEQLSGSIEETGPRSDVYALGALLFEVLAERTPHDLRNMSLAGAARYLETHEPPPLARVEPRFRGDPSTIVAKALARNPEDRYASAQDLGADLMRWVRNEPIQARPPSVLYRARKFAQRNRLMVSAGLLTFLGLSTGTAVASWQAVSARRAQRASDLAEQSARAVSDFLIKEVLVAATPDVAQGESITLAQAFERAAARLHILEDEPEVQASLYHTLGEAFLSLGDPHRARESFESALSWRNEHLGEGHRDSVNSLLGLSSALKRIPPIDDAMPSQLRAYELSLEHRGPEDEQTRTALHNLGSLYMRLERYEEAERTLRSLLESWEESEDELLRFEVMHSVGRIMTVEQRWEEAAGLLRDAAAGKQRLLGELHPSTITTEIALGINHYRSGANADAVEHLEALLPNVILVHGEDHTTTTTAREVLCNAILLLGEGMERAEPHLRHVISLRTQELNDNPSQLAHDCSMLGAILMSLDRFREAREWLDEGLERFRELDPEHPGIDWTRRFLIELNAKEADAEG